jgi:hypothetical protein
MKTLTATKKTTRKPARVTRSCSLSTAINGTHALKLTITTGNKTESYGYYLTETCADYVRGFRLEKFGVEQVEGEDSVYDVSIDPRTDSIRAPARASPVGRTASTTTRSRCSSRAKQSNPHTPGSASPGAPRRKDSPPCGFTCSSPWPHSLSRTPAASNT